MELCEKTCWSRALKLVPAAWWIELARFLEEGEASDGFLKFLEQDAKTRQACDIVLRGDHEMEIIIAATLSTKETA